MNQSKLKYARERLNALVDEAITACRPEPEPYLTYKDAANMLADGEATIPWNDYPHNNRSDYDLRDWICDELEKLIESHNEITEKHNHQLREDFKIVQAEIIAHKVRVEDELVLGDEMAALALLEEFKENYS